MKDTGPLKNANMKITPAREEILKILRQSKKPVDISTILNKLKTAAFEIDRVTVFRIMNKFAEAGIVHKLEFSEGKARYELSSLPHHHHAVCVECGSIKDIENCNLDALSNKVQEESGFQVQNHRLEFFGTCDKCH